VCGAPQLGTYTANNAGAIAAAAAAPAGVVAHHHHGGPAWPRQDLSVQQTQVLPQLVGAHTVLCLVYSEFQSQVCVGAGVLVWVCGG
jgi:hypothetical protein